jgi:hypothetical protein
MTIKVEAVTKHRKRMESHHHIGMAYWGVLADGVWYNIFREERPYRDEILTIKVKSETWHDKEGNLKTTNWADITREDNVKLNDAFPGKHLKAADILGRRVNATIDSVSLEDIGDDANKLVVHFKGKDKSLVCNVTNARVIEEIAGTDETDDWAGVQIVLYTAKVDFQGRRVDAIRVDHPPKAPAPAREAPPPRNAPVAGKTPLDNSWVAGPDNDDDIPF